MSKKKVAEAPPLSSRKAHGVRYAIILLLAAGVIAAGVWFWRRPVISSGCCPGRNVLLITLDTTRADHLPMYGYTKVRTPNLDALASSGFVFEDAISHAPITLTSHASILTGRLPIAHGVHDNSGYFLALKVKTLAEVLKDNGYSTGAFVSAFILDSRRQLNQGFDTYNDYFGGRENEDINPREIQRRGEDTEIEASNWLEKQSGKKWFLWVHFYDPHDPYNPPEPYRTEYAERPYDGEIAYTDEVVGKLLQKVDSIGAGNNTVIVLTADHGESLGEHREETHAMFLYNSTQHVPLIIRVPGTRSRRISGIVRHIDLAPTILDFLGLQPPAEMQGASLTPVINGREKNNRGAFAESRYADIHYGWSPLQSLTIDQYKYIDAPHPELYEWKKDREEKKNLIQKKATVAKVLKERLQDIVAKDSSGETQAPQKVDADTEERLRSLGYVSGSAPATSESRKIDPKDKIEQAVAVQQASGLLTAGDSNGALRYLVPVLKTDPEILEAHYIAGIAYANTGQYPQAIDEFLKTIRIQPDHIVAMYNLGYAYEITGDLKSAEYWFKKILQYDPNHLSALSKLAVVYRQMNEPQQAIPYIQKALELYDKSIRNTSSEKSLASMYSSVAELYFVGGDLQRALASLVKAEQLDPQKAMVHYNMALMFEAAGDNNRAMQEYQKETELNPSSYQAFYNLGALYMEAGNPGEAARCFEQVTRLTPRDPRGFVALAAVYRKLGRTAEAQQILESLKKH